MLFKYTLVLLVCITLIDTSDAWLFRRRNKQKLVYWDGDKKYKMVVVDGAGSAAKPTKELGCKDIVGCGGIRDAPSGIGKLVELTETSSGMADEPKKDLGCKDIVGCGKIANVPGGNGKLVELLPQAGGSAGMRDAIAAAGAT